MKHWAWILMMLLVVLGGCSRGNLLESDADGDYMQRTSTASFSRIDPQGDQQASYHGLAPSIMKADVEGLWSNSPGPETKLAMPGLGYLASPKDVTMEGFRVTPGPDGGAATITIEKLTANISTPLEQYQASLATAMATLGPMDQAAREAQVAEWEAAGTFAPGILETIRFIVAAIAGP